MRTLAVVTVLALTLAAGAAAPAPAAASAVESTSLADGLLLVPAGGSGSRQMLAFDPVTGDLVDDEFFAPDTVGTTQQVLLHPDGARMLVSDQNGGVVWAYDLDGNRLGAFAPASGADPGIMQNIRGMALHPETGHLLVSVAGGGNARAVAEFDLAGNYLGNFIENRAGGLASPWGILFRERDVLVGDIGASGPGAIRSYWHDGTPNQVLVDGINFPWQLGPTAAGDLLVGNSSGAPGAGVLEYEAGGEFIGHYDPVGGARGVYELPDGNILATNADGVHEIARDGTLVESKIEGVQARFISYLQAPDPHPVLSASPAAAGTCAGEDAAVDIDVQGVGGFDDPVHLSVTGGLPPGAGAGFTVNPVTPAFPAATSVLTVSDLPAGDHLLELAGESGGPAFPPATVSTPVTLSVHDGPPGTAVLREPADGTAGEPPRPRFSWESVPGAVAYRLQLSTDPAFTDPLEDVVVTGTGHTPATGLALGSTYHWRVAATNGCGDGAFSDTYQFTTAVGDIDVPDGDVAGLADAIRAANAAGGPVTVNLAPGGTYTLTEPDHDEGCATGRRPFNGATGLPVVTSALTLNGNGATIRRSDGDGTRSFRILAVDGRAPAAGDLTLHDVTVANGLVTCPVDGPLAYGGGILNVGGSLTLTGSTVTGSAVLVTGSRGGGISNQGGAMTLTDSTVSDNQANRGGGIQQQALEGQPPTAALTNVTVAGNRAGSASRTGGGIHTSGTMTVAGSTITENAAGRGGGLTNAGDLTLVDSTVSDNTAGFDGGGIAVDGISQNDQPVVLDLTASTVSGNTAARHGGGVLVEHVALAERPDVTLTNATVSGNTADGAGGGIIHRTSVFNGGGTVRVVASTVSGNTASVTGGIFDAVAGSVTLTNSIVAGNGGTGGDVNDFVDAGHNLVGTEPELGPLADNGGPTRTHALLPGSPARQAGDCANGTITVDQRGVSRPQGAACDIGAVEQAPAAGPGVVLTPATVDFGDVAVGDTAHATVTVSSFGTEDLVIDEVAGPASPFVVGGGGCDPGGFPLPAGSACVLEVEFGPTSAGVFTGEIEVVSDAASSPDVVRLAGTGVADAVIDIDPAALDATVTEGGTTTGSLTIGNLGTDELAWAVTGDPGPPGRVDGTTISHSASDVPLPEGSVACSPDNGATTYATSYLRTFTLGDLGIADEFHVTEVAFGVETVSATVPVTVNLYTLDGSDLTYANLTRIGAGATTVPAGDQAVVTVPAAATVPAGATLVAEVAAPNLAGAARFFPGQNNAGETAPSYIASEAEVCGIPEPTSFADLGFPQVHLVMSVTGQVGELGCGAATAGWAEVSPLAGSVPGGGTGAVEIAFDAAGLSPGDYHANLCLESSDPGAPLSVVPVSLTVLERDDEVTCDRTIVGVHPGPLTITDGVTCLAAGARVLGEVNVLPGAGLVATAAVIQGPVSASGARLVDVSFSQVTGPVTINGTTGAVSLFGSQVTGSVLLLGSTTGTPAVVGGNTIIGSLSCAGNDPAPVDLGVPNTVVGGTKVGQCAEL